MCLLMETLRILNEASKLFAIFGTMNLYLAIWISHYWVGLLLQGVLSLFIALVLQLIIGEGNEAQKKRKR